MKLPLINSTDVTFSNEILKSYYDEKLIPAEKKSYMTKLEDSVGPYLGIQGSDGKTHYILDAASQIATLGHGFNSSIFFGTSTFLESWINDTSTDDFKKIRNSFKNFFARKLNWKNVGITFVHSGAEANETALGYCYQRRVNANANKVLAFEGSFHGRMMVTLAATWNKSKREPFEWQDYLAEYVKYPEINDDKINVEFPDLWRETWNHASVSHFKIPENWLLDSSLKNEIESLLKIREKLLAKDIFSIIVEPMQCEGGDCYSSDRFHTALLLMAKTFQVPVIHDEVQTGFHLGKDFFWHRQFNLKNVDGNQLNPDYVVCAKKAQIGIVLSHHETKQIFKGEEFSVASTIRGYTHAISLDQNQKRIVKIEKQARPRIEALLSKYSEFIHRPRTNGLAFAFDLKDSTLLNKFVDLRFKYGLLYYPAGNQTLRFRLNTSFKEKDLDFLFSQLDKICSELFLSKILEQPIFVETDHHSSTEYYEWHKLFIETKLKNIDSVDEKKYRETFKLIESMISKYNDFKIIEITAQNFINYRQDIIDLQKLVYEPARQTDIEKFEHTVLHKNSICLGAINNNKLIGIAFAGPLKLYPLERGVRMDPHFTDDNCLYMLDVTVNPTTKGSRIGKTLKYALSALATSNGIVRIQGRNRDRLASTMLNINLSLGAFEQNYIREDYPDFEQFRDVFYYTTKAKWSKPTIHLSKAITMPISLASIKQEYINLQLPYLINKVCLSNFVSEYFLNGLRQVLSPLPKDLRHGYTCSGQSEAIDKIAKTIWVKSDDSKKKNNVTKMLTFKNHYFGNGSMLARSLSLDYDPYFKVTQLNHPEENNYTLVLKEVEAQLKAENYLAIWIEPILQKTMQKVPFEFLKELRILATKYNVALVFNETGSSSFRYSNESFYASGINEINPDAGIIYFGGQAGFAYTSSKYFLEQPLMLISTWDGDEFSFNTYLNSFKSINSNKKAFLETAEKFQKKLTLELNKYNCNILRFENGTGYFSGAIPEELRKMFSFNGHHYVICPSYDCMQEYLNL